MVFFSLILGWSLLRPLGRFDGSDGWTTCNLHKKGDPAELCRSSLRWLSQFLPYEKEFNCFLWRNYCIPFFMVEWVGIYKGEIVVTFLVGW